MAAQNPNRAIPFFDHSLNGRAGRRTPIANAIYMLTQGDVRITPFTTLSDAALLLRLPRAILDWYPDEYSLGTLSARQAGTQAGQNFVDLSVRGVAAEDLANIFRETVTQSMQQVLSTFQTVQSGILSAETAAREEAQERREEMQRRAMEEMSSMLPQDRFAEDMLPEAQRAHVPPTAASPKEVKRKLPPKPKVPRSAWDRLLDDDEEKKG